MKQRGSDVQLLYAFDSFFLKGEAATAGVKLVISWEGRNWCLGCVWLKAGLLEGVVDEFPLAVII